MSCFLFDKIVFGPVSSRRLGVSLGINLLRYNKKVCSFNCIYCECGWTKPGNYVIEKPYTREEVKLVLEEKLIKLKSENSDLNNITFAGNGEPTLHPQFHLVVDDVITLRNKYFPDVSISVLTNATQLDKPHVVSALKKVNKPIVKLDTSTENSFRAINKAVINISYDEVLNNIIKADISNLIIQTLFLRGNIDGNVIDNTEAKEVELWIGHLIRIKPAMVMIYGIARETPAKDLVKISRDELEVIAKKLRKKGIKTETY